MAVSIVTGSMLKGLCGAGCRITTICKCKGYARADLAWTKNKRSLINEKLRANRASETEEQRKERLRIRRKEENRKPREIVPGHSQKIEAR